MADDKTKQLRDRRTINIHEKYELQYWSKKFGVSAKELRDAVERVGTSARSVERELKKRAA